MGSILFGIEEGHGPLIYGVISPPKKKNLALGDGDAAEHPGDRCARS